MNKRIITGIFAGAMLLACGAFAACGSGKGGNNGDNGDKGEHTHKMVEHEYRDASCTENGNKLYWECTECDKYFSDSAGGSEYTDKSEVTIAAHHNLIPVDPTEASCTKAGNIAYWQCHECEAVFTDSDATDAVEKEEVLIAASGHDYVYNEAHSEQISCVVAGWNEYHTCSRCQYTTQAGYFASHTLRQVGGGYICGSCTMDLTGTEGLEYTLNGDGETYTVTGIGTATATEIVIPFTFDGKSVTAIGQNAFKDCDTITEVIIVSGVTGIGQGAFYGCAAMEYIDIPTTVTSIGAEAFYNCESLTYVRIPDGVTNIDGKVFYGCSKLQGVEITNSVKSISDSAFGNCSDLVHIDFDGTKYQWEGITKTYSWNDNTGKDYLVYCVDATVTADGNDVVISSDD